MMSEFFVIFVVLMFFLVMALLKLSLALRCEKYYDYETRPTLWFIPVLEIKCENMMKADLIYGMAYLRPESIVRISIDTPGGSI